MERVTLTQAARALGVAQHKLIHLCEKGVVLPDLYDARGRGSSRGFSRRNFFEFAVALEMRRLGLPVALIRAIVLVLRSFEAAVASTMPGFALPASLQSSGAPTVTALIVDGQHLFFSVAGGRSTAVVFGGIELPKRSTKARLSRSPEVHRLSTAAAKRLIASAKTRTEIDLTRIAFDLPQPKA
jgi:hypothetical protein